MVRTTQFVLTDTPGAIDTGTFGELLRLLSAYTFTPTQAEHANVILKGQTRPWA